MDRLREQMLKTVIDELSDEDATRIPSVVLSKVVGICAREAAAFYETER